MNDLVVAFISVFYAIGALIVFYASWGATAGDFMASLVLALYWPILAAASVGEDIVAVLEVIE